VRQEQAEGRKKIAVMDVKHRARCFGNGSGYSRCIVMVIEKVQAVWLQTSEQGN
jgi:hypothetical protein